MSRERHRMLQLLSSRDWVASDTLSAEFCQYGRIIFQLRREGFEIINKVVPTSRGGKRGYFKWVSLRESVAVRLANSQAVSPEEMAAAQDSPTLFDLEGGHSDE
jgi:hypothetical protein